MVLERKIKLKIDNLIYLIIFIIFFIFPLFKSEKLYSNSNYTISNKDIRVSYKMGTETLQKKHYKDAIIYFKNILNNGSSLPEARNNLAFAYLKLGKIDEAIDELKKALNTKPEYADAMNNLAIAYLKKKGFEKNALYYARRATEIDKKNSSYHDTLGLAYQSLKLYKKATYEYKLAYLIDNKNVGSAIHLGKLLIETGDKDEAILTFRKVLDQDPDNLEANWNLYKFFIKEKKYNSAKFRFEKLFKGITLPESDINLVKKVRNSLICYFKSFLTELAVIISRTETNKRDNNDFFINYSKFHSTVVADLIPIDQLFCPVNGKFYTSFINHVICPIHGYSEILTESLQDIREMRKRYNRQICLRCRYGLAFALNLYRLKTGKKFPKNFNVLIKEGYLVDIPKCPNGGKYELDDRGLIRCDVHGNFEQLK